MSIPLNIRGTVYNYPQPGEDQGVYGDEATSWAEAVTETLDLLLSGNDILPTAFLVENDVNTPTIIRGLYFNPGQVRAANISYSVYRQTDSGSVVESGELLINYDANATVNEKWKVLQRTNGEAGIIITAQDDGQFYYQTTNLLGTNYTALLRFSARSLSQ